MEDRSHEASASKEPALSPAEVILTKYQPRYLGEGGGHIVYEIPKYPNVVVKAHKPALEKVRQYMETQNIAAPDATIRDWMQARLRNESARLDELRTFFPEETFLQQRSFFMEVPLPEPHDAAGVRPWSETPKSGWTIARVQEKMPEEAHAGFSLTVGYAERKRRDEPLTEEVYWQLTNKVLSNDVCTEWEVRRLHPSLGKAFDAWKTHPESVQQVALFIKSAIRYANATGNTLDTAGEGNIQFFTTKQGQDTFLLLDAFEENSDVLGIGLRALADFRNGRVLDKQYSSGLLNALNFVRGMNALASILHIQERIRGFETLSGLSSDQRHALFELLQGEFRT